MKMLIILTAAVGLVAVTGCAWLASDATGAVVGRAVDALAAAVEQQADKQLADVPMHCDVETAPGRVYMLCTACTDGDKVCR